jgi:SAM-dependent methyltransferase
MKYHEYINIRHYRLAKEKGLTSRDEPYGGESFDECYNSTELPGLLARARLPANSDILVIGTGSGADACWLADHGHTVTAIDIVHDAIDMAREISQSRGSKVAFIREDICNVKGRYSQYDAIIDSGCLQSIVSNQERENVFSFVKQHLRGGGFYLILCVACKPNDYNDEYFRDAETAIVYQKAKNGELDLEDIKTLDGVPFLPVRRHHTAESLTSELQTNGFHVLGKVTGEERGALEVVASVQQPMSDVAR